MSEVKNKGYRFIIPKPVHEVKEILQSHEKRDVIRHIKIECTQSSGNMSEWQVIIRQSDKILLQSSRMLTWKERFSGYIRYHTVDSTEFEGQVMIPESYDDHLLTNIFLRSVSVLMLLGFIIFGISFLPISPPVLIILAIGLVIVTFRLIWPYLVQQSKASAGEASYKDNEDILSIIRDLAPDDVII